MMASAMNGTKTKFVNFDSLDPFAQSLITKSREARKLAYCKYSNFPVGAALVGINNEIYTGCNIENCSFGLTVCAERTAVLKAVSTGMQKFISIAVTAEMKDEFVSPCGACRQVLFEFSDGNMIVYLCRTDTQKILVTTLEELLPMSFNPMWTSFNNSQ